MLPQQNRLLPQLILQLRPMQAHRNFQRLVNIFSPKQAIVATHIEKFDGENVRRPPHLFRAHQQRRPMLLLPPPEEAPRTPGKNARRGRTVDSHPNARRNNLPQLPIHKESPPADSSPPSSAAARQTRQSIFPDPFHFSLSETRCHPERSEGPMHWTAAKQHSLRSKTRH